MTIKVGIKTDGVPKILRKKDYTLVENMLIGDGFHWQNSISVKLPGIVEEVKQVDFSSDHSYKADDNISLINFLPLETYLECVVGSEMNPEAPIEFLKAHAVISRSWALGKIKNLHSTDRGGIINDDHTIVGWDDTAGHYGFNVCSDDHCQRYQGLQPIPEKALQAIRDTKGEVLLSNDGILIDTRFSKCCGGATEIFSTCWQNIQAECIASFLDPWCDLSQKPISAQRSLISSILKDYDRQTRGYGYRWEELVSKDLIKINLREKFGRNIGEIERVTVVHRGPSGRIDLIRLHGSISTLDFGKELWIRRLFSSSHLYSSAFEIEDLGKDLRLKGKGWGHGVGLCQIGAANMASEGYGYKEILSHYYPGSHIGQEKDK